MLYTLADTEKAVAAGFSVVTHRLIDNGRKMILNENELRLLNNNIDEAAHSLKGEVLSYIELNKIINK